MVLRKGNTVTAKGSHNAISFFIAISFGHSENMSRNILIRQLKENIEVLCKQTEFETEFAYHLLTCSEAKSLNSSQRLNTNMQRKSSMQTQRTAKPGKYGVYWMDTLDSVEVNLNTRFVLCLHFEHLKKQQ
ncbi:Protection Of Telomeres Protein 1 [Manis pentadactyla]|nr:Protection Of Telomeres Protein 1 [Manis pentadactyla]